LHGSRLLFGGSKDRFRPGEIQLQPTPGHERSRRRRPPVTSGAADGDSLSATAGWSAQTSPRIPSTVATRIEDMENLVVSDRAEIENVTPPGRSDALWHFAIPLRPEATAANDDIVLPTSQPRLLFYWRVIHKSQVPARGVERRRTMNSKTIPLKK
jgi:hypothetical protein